MTKFNELLGTKYAEYESINEFADALKASETQRLHTYFNSGFLGIGRNWTAAFIDSNKALHGLVTHDVENLGETSKPIYNHLKVAGIPEVDGVIRLSQRDSAIYQVFQTEDMNNDERREASFKAWINTVQNLPFEGTVIQYLKEDSAVIFDATNGKDHFITTIDENYGRTLDQVLDYLRNTEIVDGTEISGKQFQMRDNTPVINWYRDMKLE